MSDDDKPLQRVEGTPESFGWQRRPDFDTKAGQAWESPTGEVKLFPRGGRPVFVRIKDRPFPIIKAKP